MTQEVAAEVEYVNHPRHYNVHKSGLECIELVRFLDFNTGSAVKYVWRMGEKFDAVEDAKKALWYLNDELNNPNPEYVASSVALDLAKRFADAEDNKNVAGIVLATTTAMCSTDASLRAIFIKQAIEYNEALIASF